MVRPIVFVQSGCSPHFVLGQIFFLDHYHIETGDAETSLTRWDRETAIMSESQLHDNYSIALADVERLVEVWSDLSATQTKQFGVGYLLVRGVEALMPRQMDTPYSITIEALQRLSAFRKRITHLNIRDQFFEEKIEDLVVAVIKERAASQPLRPKHSAIFRRKSWECRAFEALEEWLKTRDMLLTSFGAEGAVVEQLNIVIKDKAMDLLTGWDPFCGGDFVRGLEIREKLKAFPDIATSFDEELICHINHERSTDHYVDFGKCDARPDQAPWAALITNT